MNMDLTLMKGFSTITLKLLEIRQAVLTLVALYSTKLITSH